MHIGCVAIIWSSASHGDGDVLTVRGPLLNEDPGAQQGPVPLSR